MNSAKHLYEIIKTVRTLGTPRRIEYERFQGNLVFQMKGGSAEIWPTENFIRRPEEEKIMIHALKQAFRGAKIVTHVVLDR